MQYNLSTLVQVPVQNSGDFHWKAPEFLCFMRFSRWFVEKLLFHVAHNSDVNLVQLLGISDSPAQRAGLILFISTARAE